MKKTTLLQFCLALFFTSHARAVTIYGTAYEGATTTPAILYTIDPNTGVASPVGSSTGFARVSAIDFNPLTGVLYGVGTDAQGGVDLITISTTTGMATAVGSLNLASGMTVTDMSFRSDGTLYAIDNSFTPGIYTINLNTGNATLLGTNNSTNFVAGEALVFNSSNTLFHVGTNTSDGTNSIDTVNQMTGAFTSTGTMVAYPFAVPNNPRANAMDYDLTSGILYASILNQRTNYIGEIDLATGAVSNVQLTISGLDGLAVLPSGVPDSMSTIWLGLPVLLMLLLARHRSQTAVS